MDLVKLSQTAHWGAENPRGYFFIITVNLCEKAPGHESKFLGTRIEMKFVFFNLIIRPWVKNRISSKNGTFQFDQYTRAHDTKFSYFLKKNQYFKVPVVFY